MHHNLMSIRNILMAFLFMFILAGCQAQKTKGPELVNIETAINRVVEYHKSGQYDADVAAVAQEGRLFIDKALASGKFDKPAVVFDIDETLLSNYSAFESMKFSFNQRTWQRWVNSAKAPAIEPMLELYNYLIQQGVSVFIITGRKEKSLRQTKKNLTKSGYVDWTNLFLRQKWAVDIPAETYKTKIRQQLVEKDGYQILASFGDQESDLSGGFAEQTFKLPNYIYLIP